MPSTSDATTMRVPTVALFTLTALVTLHLSYQAIAFTTPLVVAPKLGPENDAIAPDMGKLISQANTGGSQQMTDIQGHWAQNFITALLEQNLIQGFPDGTFRPDAPVNRAEFAAILQRAFAGTPLVGAPRPAPEFADVPANSWAYSAIKTAYERGFLGKYENNLFRPDQPISRVQVLVALVQGLNLYSNAATLTDLETSFQDAATIPEYARKSVAIALALGLIAKNPNVPLLYPNQIATRADVAALIYQALAYTPPRTGQPVASSPSPPTPTSTPSYQPQMVSTGEKVPPPTPPSPAPQPAQQIPLNLTPMGVISEAYTLGAGDRVRLDNLTAPEYNGETQVLADGALNLPLIGKVSVRGMTLEQAAEAVSDKYAYYIKEPVVTVSLTMPRPLKVAIAGEVTRPGSYSIPLAESAQFPTITQAIKLAGGTSQTANLRQVLVRRPQEFGEAQIIAVNLWDLLQGADLSQDLVLRDGDAIFIPTANSANRAESAEIAGASFAADTSQPMKIVVVGEVSRPGTHTVTGKATGTEGTGSLPTVTDALAAAGGVTQSADIRQVQIRRPTRAGSEQVIAVNLWQLLQAGDPTQDVILQQGDTLVVPTANNPNPAEVAAIAAANFAASITEPLKIVVVGEVSRPGTHTVTPKASGSEGSVSLPTVTDALEAAGGITQSADIRQVQIRRTTKAASQQVITVNLWQLLQAGDRTQDIALQQGDTIVVGTGTYANPADAALIAAASFAADSATPINIAVVGEVGRPGPYTVAVQQSSGEDGTGGFPTVTKAIQVAGGITQSADIRKIEIRRLTREGSQNLTVDLWQLLQAGDLRQDVALQQGDTIVIPTATSLTAAEATELAAASFSPDKINVNVVGEVVRPGGVQVPPNTPLNQALLAAGGFNNRARKASVELIRLNANGTVAQRRVEVDLDQSINEETNPILRTNDVIVVDRSRLAKVTDTVGAVVSPIGSVFSIFNFFRLFQ